MRFRGLQGFVLLAIVVLLVLPSTASFYTDWLWFGELGYQGVFTKTLNAQAMAFLFTFAPTYLFLYFNLRFAGRRVGDRPRVSIGRTADGRPIDVDGSRVAGAAMPVAFAVAFVVGLMGGAQWLTWLRYLNAQAFGTTDPLFGHDVAFYVFKLPIYQLVRQQALLVAFVALIGGSMLYVFSGSFMIEAQPRRTSWPRVRLIPVARRHLSLLTALILGLLAWGAWLDLPSLLITPTDGPVAFGASYADVHAKIPFLWATIGVLMVGAALSIWHGFGQRGWPLPLAIVSYIVVSATAGVYSGLLQTFVVSPNEQEKERPYIEYNIRSTREAYALDRVEEREVSGDAELTAKDIVANAATIENIRLWDHAPLLQTFSQIQEIRTYYDFHSIDNDRYVIDGKYRQVMLSAREINNPNQTWVNQHLTYTHGYGLTLGPVNQVTTEGLPVLFIRDLPPVSTVNLPVRQPSIYFGELTNDYVLVKARQPEFHYPTQTGNENTFYDGAGGVPIGSFLRRLLFAMRFTSTDILVTSQLTPDSRILFKRNIVDRVKTLAPFLTLDADPYPVVHDGRIVWVQDAYTTTSHYPYATPHQADGALAGANYIRNSVKAVIDAYDGGVTFYVSEPDDPLVQTIGRIFPGLLHPLADMPAGLRDHVRYPEDIFRVQADKFATYHMTDPEIFYRTEDQWASPVPTRASPITEAGVVKLEPYYTVMRIPGEKTAEFLQMVPFTPRAKDNLSAWLVARSDGPRYGHLLVFRFPKQKLVPGPQQIVARINQNEVISPQITLWNQLGSEVIQGTLLVIPVEESLLYVQPIYLRSANGKIPELKRVVVAYQDRIVMRETLTLALAEIFGQNLRSALAPDQLASSATSVVQTAIDPGLVATPSTTTPGATPAATGGTATLAELATQAGDLFKAATEAQRAGDWARYGELMKELEAVLARMQSAR